MEILKKRRTHRAFKKRIPNKELKDILIEAGKYTPNHQLRYPYRFEVINDETSFNKLLKLAKENHIQLPKYFLNLINESSFDYEKDAPTYVVVICPKSSDDKILNEDILANGALIQNIHLLANELGYSLCWKTYFFNKDFPYLYGIDKDEIVTGFLIMGSPDEEPKFRDYNQIEIDIKGFNE